LKTISGKALNIRAEYVGRVSTRVHIIKSHNCVVLAEKMPKFAPTSSIYILPDDNKNDSLCNDNKSIVYIDHLSFKELNEGDIIKIGTNGIISVIWEESSSDNLIFTTDFCNSACIMCPQVPEGKPYSYYKQNIRMVELIKDTTKLKSVGITGGEPTIFKDELIQILKLCFSKFPSIYITMLTNGKNFDDFDFAKQCALANPNIKYCIPLYAASSEKHDYIVGTKGSFIRTINGIYNLIRLKRPIEIRVVIMKNNYKDLPLIADYIFHNMPFVTHVVLMGMEISGIARKNFSDIWIDPIDYRFFLRQAGLELKRYNIPFSIYNIPRCLLLKELWGYDRDSISSWKKSYLPQCKNCREKENCCGIFTTSMTQSESITPIY